MKSLYLSVILFFSLSAFTLQAQQIVFEKLSDGQTIASGEPFTVRAKLVGPNVTGNERVIFTSRSRTQRYAPTRLGVIDTSAPYEHTFQFDVSFGSYDIVAAVLSPGSTVYQFSFGLYYFSTASTKARIYVKENANARTIQTASKSPKAEFSAGSIETGLLTYPNPFVDEFTLTYQGETSEAISLQIVNSLGQEIQRLPLRQKTQKISLGSNVPTGMYYVNVTDNGNIIQRSKIIKTE
jgi:hypothetical protein